MADQKLSELDDSGTLQGDELVYVVQDDESYKTTVNNMRGDGEANVQADYTETDDTLDSFIKNKPDLSTYAIKTQTSDTDTVYDDKSTDTNYKLYVDNGDIILEEL